MKKYFLITTPLLLLIAFISFLLGSRTIRNNPILNSIATNQEITEFTPITTTSPTPIPDFDYYKNLLDKTGLQVVSSMTENLYGTNKQSILVTIGKDCGSCHYNEIHIYDNKKEVFVFYGEDTHLIPIKGFGFVIEQPVYKDSYSDRSEYQSALYLWNGKTFTKTKTSPNWIDSPQVPG